MYIPEFWCGFAAAILVEILIIFITVLILTSKESVGKEKDEKNNP